MAGVKGRSGGKRSGAGRKSKADLYKPQIDRMEKRLAGKLASNTDNIQKLADGGLQQVSETLEPAAVVLIDAFEDIKDQDGKPTGKVSRKKVQAFPTLPPEQLVTVRRTITTMLPNLAANVYLVNRVAGSPSGQEEPEEQETGPPPPDLSRLTDEELELYVRLAAKCAGSDPGEGGTGEA